MHNISDIMNKDVITIAPDETVSRAVSLMEKNGIKELPVVSGNSLLGVLKLYSVLEQHKIHGDEKVKNYLSQVPSIADDDGAERAIEIMAGSGEELLLVFNSKKKLVGVVSDYDILKACKSMFNDAQVSQFIRKMRAVSSGDSVAKVKRYMEKSRLDRLPVQKDGRYIGQVMSSDLLRATSNLTRKAYASKAGESIGSTKIPVGNLVRFEEHVHENEPVTKAIETMLRLQIRGIPVLSTDSEVLGILARRDLILHLIKKQDGIPLQFSGDGMDSFRKAEISQKLGDRIKTYENVESIKVHAKKLKGTRYEVYLKAKVGKSYFNVKKSGKIMPALDECIHDLKILIKSD